MRKREGPQIEVKASCFDCTYECSVSYAVQGDSGCTVYCTHPAVQVDGKERRYVADTSWRTPGWCPLLAAALAATQEDRHAE